MSNSLTKIMSKSQFDLIIRDNIIEKNNYTHNPNYISTILNPETHKYPCYYTDVSFARFRKTMRLFYKNAYQSYVYGAGSELFSNKANQPPKMASVASSSRFCYLAFRNGAKAIGGGDSVVFEKSCKLANINATAQLDAYDKSTNTYIEVKCHEIFDDPEPFIKTYINYFQKYNNYFGFTTNHFKIQKNSSFYLDLFPEQNIDTSGINVKQLVCHLIGIASQKEVDEPATLMYLFFKPKNEANSVEIDNLFESLKTSIRRVFNNNLIQGFCSKNRITLKAFAEYDIIMTELTSQNMIRLY